MLRQNQLDEINDLFEKIRKSEKKVKQLSQANLSQRIENVWDFSEKVSKANEILLDFTKKANNNELKLKIINLIEVIQAASKHYINSILSQAKEKKYKEIIKEKDQAIFKLIDEKKELEKQLKIQEQINKL